MAPQSNDRVVSPVARVISVAISNIRKLGLPLALLLTAQWVVGQVNDYALTEVPFRAAETHGIETIELSDLSVDLKIPVRHKPGLIPWSMVLDQHMAYSTSFSEYGIESDTFVGSTFRPYIEGLTAQASIYSDSNGIYGGIRNCPYDSGDTYTLLTNFAVITSDGASHGTTPPSGVPLTVREGSCPHGGEGVPTTGSATTNDGTGYSIYVDYTAWPGGTIIGQIYDKDGNAVLSNAIPTLIAGTGASSGPGTAWTNPGDAHSTTAFASITISGAGGTYQALRATEFGFSVNYKPANIVTWSYYYTTGNATNGGVNVQLLKNGSPVGSPQFRQLYGGYGSATSPLPMVFNFSDPELTASDINNSEFGVQITPTGGQSGDTLSIYVRDVTITPDAYLLVDRDGNQRDDNPAIAPTAGETCQNYPYPYPCSFTFKYLDMTGNSPLTILAHSWESSAIGGPAAQCQGTIYFAPDGNCVNNGAIGGQYYLPDSLTYANESGNTVGYYLTYTTYNFLGNFGCPNGGDALKPNQVAVLPTKVAYPDGGVLTLVYEQSFGKDSTWTTGRLKSLTLPTGGVVTYAYTGGSNGINCTDGTPATMTRTTSDGTTTYTHTPGGIGIPVGNGSTVVTDPFGNTTTYSFWGDASTSFNYENQRVEKSAAGTALRTTVTCYNGVTNLTQCVNGPWVSVDSSTSNRVAEMTKYITDNVSGLSYKVDVTYDYNGSVLSSTTYNWGSSTILKQTENVYGSWNGTSCVALGNHISDTLCDAKILDGAGNVLSETRYTYNAQGDKTVESVWTGSSWLTTSFARNSTGTTSLKTAPNGSQVQYTYNDGCGGNYLTQEKQLSGAELEMDYSVDCTTGNVLTATDPNGNVVANDYTAGGADPLLRVKSTTDQAGATTTYSYTPTSVESILSINDGASSYDRYSKVDGYDRPWIDQVLNPASTWDTTTSLYDAAGRPAGSVLPCSTSKGSPCTGPHTSIQYDALNRVIARQDAGGGYVNTTFNGKDILVTLGPAVTTPATENVKSTQYEQDTMARINSVCEVTSAGSACGQGAAANGFLTSYTRTTRAGSSTLTVSQGVQTRTYQYDALNRLVSELNPETGSSSPGTISYTYDTQSSTCGGLSFAGLLVEKILNDGTHICYQYDTLGRIRMIGNSKSADCSYFVYDTATNPPSGVIVANGKGHVVEQYTTSAACGTSATVVTDEWFSYDPRGRLANVWEKTPSSGIYFNVGATYYENGIEKAMTFANMGSLSTITYGLDSQGRAFSASPDYVTATTYNSNNQPLTIQFATSTGGNGDYDTLTYDPNTDRIASTAFTIGATPKSVINQFTWNVNSSLQQLAVTDPFYKKDQNTCVYAHDDLGRLASFDCGSTWTQTFTYDQYGNLTKSGSQSWACAACYDATTNHYNQKIASTISYDTNGNILNDNINTYTWDSYGRMASIFDGTSTHTITYDAQGREVEKSSPTQEVVWGPTGKVALMSGKSTVSATFIPLAGGSTLNVSGSTKFIRHANFNGTTTVESNLSGRTVNSDKAFAPFGETFAIGAAGNGDTSYTGMTQTTSAGVYDFEKRKLLAAGGRWISPDPAGIAAVHMRDPQTWNRYAYVGNIPESLSDPLGLTAGPELCEDGCYGADGGGWVAEIGFGLSIDGIELQVQNTQYTQDSVNDPAKTKPANGSQVGDSEIGWIPGVGFSGWYPGGPEYTVDGVATFPELAQALLGSGAGLICPNNACSGFNAKGQYMQYGATQKDQGYFAASTGPQALMNGGKDASNVKGPLSMQNGESSRELSSKTRQITNEMYIVNNSFDKGGFLCGRNPCPFNATGIKFAGDSAASSGNSRIPEIDNSVFEPADNIPQPEQQPYIWP